MSPSHMSSLMRVTRACLGRAQIPLHAMIVTFFSFLAIRCRAHWNHVPGFCRPRSSLFYLFFFQLFVLSFVRFLRKLSDMLLQRIINKPFKYFARVFVAQISGKMHKTHIILRRCTTIVFVIFGRQNKFLSTFRLLNLNMNP